MTKDGVATAPAARRLALDIFSRQEASVGYGHAGDSAQGVRHGRSGLQHAGRASTASTGSGKGGGRRGRRLPRRLRAAVPLLEEMARRARRCNFGRLLEAYCPLPSSVRETTRRCVLERGRRAAGVRGRVDGEPEPTPFVGSAEGDVDVEVVDSLASPWSQDEESGEEFYGDGEDEGEMCSGSTMKDISPPGEEGAGSRSRRQGGGIRDGEPEKSEEEQEVDSGFSVEDISPGEKGTGGKGRGVEEGEEGEPDERVTKRRRLADANDTDGDCWRSEGVSYCTLRP